MKKLHLFLAFFAFTFSSGQIFEITNGQSMCMVGKGQGQDASINPYATRDFSFAIIENIGSVDFEIKIESTEKGTRQFSIKPNDKTVVKLFRDNVLYIVCLGFEKARALVNYTINENELPPPPPPIN